jgi:hypothetical protein
MREVCAGAPNGRLTRINNGRGAAPISMRRCSGGTLTPVNALQADSG